MLIYVYYNIHKKKLLLCIEKLLNAFEGCKDLSGKYKIKVSENVEYNNI